MHRMLQQPEPSDYVIATGITHSVLEFCELAFAEADLDYREFVKTDEAFNRPAEVDLLIGDASKAQTLLDWMPTHDFRSLVKEMVHSDLKFVSGQRSLAAQA